MPAEVIQVDPGQKKKPKEPVDWNAVHRQEAVDFVRKFYRASYDWRQQAYHSNWDCYERNYRNIYDPGIKAKKETWQSLMFIPVTVSNVEVISSALTKLAAGRRRPLALEPREMGDELQAELNTDLLDYFREKGDYELARYDAVKEACIFGSGFIKIFWEKRTAKRPRVSNDYSLGERKLRKDMKDVVVKDCIRYQHVHIRDIFPEPNSLSWNRYIHRDKLTYGELVKMADQKLFDKDSVDELLTTKEGDTFEVDVSTVKLEQGLTDPGLVRPDYDKKHTVWEFNGMVPMKWVSMGMKEDTPEEKKKANELVMGRILVASGNHYLASGLSDSYDDTPNLMKMDYIRTGQTYGVGVAQLIAGLQEEINEIRNQRMDNVSLILNKAFLVMEKYIVDPKELRSKPGANIRIKGSMADLNDVKKVVAELEISDVAISAFRETGELERQIQETSAANRVTIGSAGLKGDTNKTLGGMELLKQAAFDRFTVYAFIIGRMFDVSVAKKSMEQIYLNAGDDLVRRVLGEVPIEMLPRQSVPRWQAWKRQAPEDLNICYDYVPVDVFSMENKFQKSQDMMSKAQLTASLIPGWNPKPVVEKMWRMSEMGSDEISAILESIPDGPLPVPPDGGKGIPSVARPTKQNVGERPPVPTNGNNGVMSAPPVG